MIPSDQQRKIVFCFGGQGSQYHHMAADLLADDPVFRIWMEEGDRLLRERHGLSVLTAIYDEANRPSEPFDRIENTHPALFLVQYALAKTIIARGVEPDLMLGVSLGEFVAMAVAEMIPFEVALDAVATLPPILLARCEPGGMIAVLARDSVHSESPILAERSEIAGIGSPRTFVLTAPKDDLAVIEAHLRQRRIIFQRLPVPFAFHSRWIDSAMEACRTVFGRLDLSPPRIPSLSSCAGDLITTDTPDMFWRTLRAPMSVGARIGELEAQGGAVYVDFSPSGSIAGLARQSLARTSRSRLAPLLSPFGGNLNRIESAIRRML